MLRMWSLLLVVCAAVGCTRSYEVSVHNKTPAAITLWLTKDGGPQEVGWLSPEQLTEKQNLKKNYGMANILPGDTGYTDKLSGRFDSGTNAVLRVYHGNFDLRDILQRKPEHTDYTLKPGVNTLAAELEGAKMVIKPVPAASVGTK